MNDGSTDDSAAILELWATKDERVKVITQQNAGLSAARNTGLEHATGEWVTGVDSDDFLFPGIYEQLVSCCKEGIDLVFYGVQYVTETGERVPTSGYFNLLPEGEYPMSPEIAKKLNVCFVSKLWRRSLLEKNGLRFPVGLVHEDEALYYLASPYTHSIAVCPTIGYAYMQRAGSIMKEQGLTSLKKAERYRDILRFVYQEYKKRGLLSTAQRDYLKTMMARLCYVSYHVNPPSERDAVHSMMYEVVEEAGMQHEGYLLERMKRHESKGALSITRYRCVKIYKWFGLPIWCSLYMPSGERMTPSALLSYIARRIRR